MFLLYIKSFDKSPYYQKIVERIWKKRRIVTRNMLKEKENTKRISKKLL